MSTTEHARRTAIARSSHLNPGAHPYRKPDELSKKDLQEMLREAVLNTAAPSKD